MNLPSLRSPRVLIDTSILSCGHVAYPQRLTTTTIWDGRRKDLSVSRGFIRKPTHNEDKWKRRQIECVPTIANIVLKGSIEGFISREVQLEYLRGPRKGRQIGNAFASVPLKTARVPIYRSRFRNSTGFDRSGLYAHCKTLATFPLEQVDGFLNEFAELMGVDDFEQQSFRDIATFQAICRADNEGKHHADAFHLWTAERNGIGYFCMIDKKFANYINHQRQAGRVVVKCKVVGPEQLLDILGVKELVPHPLKDGWFYHYGGGEEKIDEQSKDRWNWRNFFRGYGSLAPE